MRARKEEFFIIHHHPYEIFIPKGTQKIISGTLPPPRFSLGELRERDVDFCYGSCDGLLWPVLDRLFSLSLRYDNSREAVEQRKAFLKAENLGICDIVASCRREKVDASDLGMEDIVLRDIIEQLQKHSTIETLIFAGGNSKNGPEYLFRKQLREHGLKLACVEKTPPRVHHFNFEGRKVETVSIISPSKAANRAIGSTSKYKERKMSDPSYTPFDFRIEQYRYIFRP